MLVVGIDPGTARTGYGFVERAPDGTLRALEYGVITTAASEPLPVRLLQSSSQLTELVSLHRPHSAAVERLFYRQNVASAMSVGQARGVALLTLAQAGLTVGEYTPLEGKGAICGYGRGGQGTGAGGGRGRASAGRASLGGGAGARHRPADVPAHRVDRSSGCLEAIRFQQSGGARGLRSAAAGQRHRR